MQLLVREKIVFQNRKEISYKSDFFFIGEHVCKHKFCARETFVFRLKA